MGGKDNGVGSTHSPSRPSCSFKGQGGAVELVGAKPIGQCQDFFNQVEPSRIKFDVAPAGGADPCPNQVATLSAVDGFEI